MGLHPPVPDKTPCIHCKAIGFVRREHVVKGGESLVEFYCGRCEHSWTVVDGPRSKRPQPERREPGRKPERSR